MATHATAQDAVAAVRKYMNAFNNGDVKAMVACFASTGSILDGMAPHLWQGPTAAQDWYRDALVEGEHIGATDFS